MTQINIGKRTMEVQTHPNAPVVVNFYRRVGKERWYNTDPRKMKYSSAANAQFMADVMNSSSKRSVWYIANEA